MRRPVPTQARAPDDSRYSKADGTAEVRHHDLDGGRCLRSAEAAGSVAVLADPMDSADSAGSLATDPAAAISGGSVLADLAEEARSRPDPDGLADPAEIRRSLKTLRPSPAGLACPLAQALTQSLGFPWIGNPSPGTAAGLLRWPVPVAEAIAAKFDEGYRPFVGLSFYEVIFYAAVGVGRAAFNDKETTQ